MLRILAVMLLTSCAIDPHGKVYISPEFNETTLEDIRTQLTAWHVATDNGVGLKETSDPTVQLVIKPGTVDRPHAGNTHSDTWSKTIEIDTAYIGGDRHVMRSMVGHELGHALGLDHLDSGIMSEPTDYECIDDLAVEEFCGYRWCGAKAKGLCDDSR